MKEESPSDIYDDVSMQDLFSQDAINKLDSHPSHRIIKKIRVTRDQKIITYFGTISSDGEWYDVFKFTNDKCQLLYVKKSQSSNEKLKQSRCPHTEAVDRFINVIKTESCKECCKRCQNILKILFCVVIMLAVSLGLGVFFSSINGQL